MQVHMSKFSARSLDIPGIILVTPKKIGDVRGYFIETYNVAEYSDLGINATFVQDNQSLSEKSGTVRGLHFQIPPKSQAKLIRVLQGGIFDVAVDLRRGSPTYGRWCAARLTAEGGEQLFVPRGFAHGYCSLEPNTEVAYKVDEYYAPECEVGLIWDDSTIGISWPVTQAEAVLSERDRKLPLFTSFDSPFHI
jgi:dTDP-4-dehydrorhamnose 3,5-epimerase